jgi:hypothetical protein
VFHDVETAGQDIGPECIETTNMSRRIAAILSLAAFFGIVAYGLWPEKRMGSRDLQCTAVPDARAQIICRRLEQEMEWTWMGHAIISPGWRVSFKSVRRTYCTENIGPRDISALKMLRQTAKDWRAESGAEFLLRLVWNEDGTGDEDITSIFNPANPSFVLKDGCSR